MKSEQSEECVVTRSSAAAQYRSLNLLSFVGDGDCGAARDEIAAHPSAATTALARAAAADGGGQLARNAMLTGWRLREQHILVGGGAVTILSLTSKPPASDALARPRTRSITDGSHEELNDINDLDLGDDSVDNDGGLLPTCSRRRPQQRCRRRIPGSGSTGRPMRRPLQEA